LNRKNELEPYLFECQINSEVVISCIDDFCSTLKKKTVLGIDNASTHTSNAVKNKQEEWAKKGLTIFYLPTYSLDRALRSGGVVTRGAGSHVKYY